MLSTVYRAAVFTSASTDPTTDARRRSPSTSTERTPGQGRERLGRYRRAEADLHDAQCLGLELTHWFDRDEPARAHDGDTIRDALDLREHVRRQQHCGPARRRLADEGAKGALRDGVETARRFVEHEQLRLVRQRLHDADLLPVSSGQRADRAVERHVEAIGEAGRGRDGRRPVQGGDELQELVAGQAVVQREVARYVADPAAQRGAARDAGRCRGPRRARGSGGSGRGAAGSSWSCRRRSGRGTRRPRRARR